MTDLSATDTRPRHIFTNDEKAHLYTKIRLIMGQIDQSKGALFDYQYADENLQAFIEGRAQALPRIVPDPVPYVQVDWSDLSQVPLEALGMSVTITNILRREGIDTVQQLVTTPEAELFGESRPKIFGPKRIDTLKQALEDRGLTLITESSQIPIDGASRLAVTSWRRLSGSLTPAEFATMYRRLGIETLADLSLVKAGHIMADLLAGDYATVANHIEWRGDNLRQCGEAPDEGNEYVLKRMANDIVETFNDVLARYDLPPLQE